MTTENLEFEGWRHLGRNAAYFFVGRHFGLVPYYFPAIVIMVWAAWRWRELTIWHALISGAVAATAIVLLLLLPNTWSGGGGPTGNRYFVSIYPAFFFLIPAARSVLPGVIMWIGGALFVAQILVDPFIAAKRPWQNTQRGLFRALPIELTMVNDLPIQLEQERARIAYGGEPEFLFDYLDDNAFRPEEPGFWVAGEARADIVVRTTRPVNTLDVTLRSPIANSVTVTVDGATRGAELQRNKPITLRFPVTGVYARRSQSFVLTVETEEGFVPTLRNPRSRDRRHLGAIVQLKGHQSDTDAASP